MPEKKYKNVKILNQYKSKHLFYNYYICRLNVNNHNIIFYISIIFDEKK